MAPPSNNIFFTYENLVLSLPLISLCCFYAYFKYVPLEIGLPILACLFVVYKIHSWIKSRRSEKLQNLDETMVKDLAGDEDEVREKAATKAQKKQNKRNQQLRQRLADERKKAATNGVNKSSHEDEDNDDEGLMVFANKKKGTKK